MQSKEKTLNNAIKEAIQFIKENKNYLLSHHLPKNYNRCLTIKGIKICSRCFGFYIGILSSVLVYSFIVNDQIFVLTAVPGIIEWTIYRLKKNSIKPKFIAINGFLMGLTYSYFLFNFLKLNITLLMTIFLVLYLTLFLIVIKKTPKN